MPENSLNTAFKVAKVMKIRSYEIQEDGDVWSKETFFLSLREKRLRYEASKEIINILVSDIFGR